MADGYGYVGTEDWVFIGDEGYGDVVCHVSYDVTATTSRTDCGNCLWAWDVTISNVTSVVDTEACASVALTDTDLAKLEGSTVSLGYDPDYVGHAQILMFLDGTEWKAVSYASWDETSSAFTYDWLVGLNAY